LDVNGIIYSEFAGSSEFLNTVMDEIRNGFPKYAGYTDDSFQNYVPNNFNSNATQSLYSVNSNNSNKSNRLSVGRRMSMRRSRSRRSRRSGRNRRSGRSRRH
jgi:hypothetical protein